MQGIKQPPSLTNQKTPLITKDIKAEQGGHGSWLPKPGRMHAVMFSLLQMVVAVRGNMTLPLMDQGSHSLHMHEFDSATGDPWLNTSAPLLQFTESSPELTDNMTATPSGSWIESSTATPAGTSTETTTVTPTETPTETSTETPTDTSLPAFTPTPTSSPAASASPTNDKQDHEPSQGTVNVLVAMASLTAFNGIPALLSHSPELDASPKLQRAVRRHESLFGENLSVRGMVQMYNYANLAFPNALKSADPEVLMQWCTAALVGFNARMAWESSESLFIFPGNPGYGNFDVMKGMMQECSVLSCMSPLSALFIQGVAVPVDHSQAMSRFNNLIGWGTPDVNHPGHNLGVTGFGNTDSLVWFQTRFHVTSVLSELFNAFGMATNDKAYTWDNGVGTLLNVWLTPQVGAIGVTLTQLVPIIGKINAVQHGTAGPELTKTLSGHVLGRSLIYSVATPLLTLPQYDIVMSMMANVPNGKGGVSGSGIGSCLKKLGRPCLAGPTNLLYEVTGGSRFAFVPLAVATIVQVAFICFRARRPLAQLPQPIPLAGGPVDAQDDPVEGTDELAPVAPTEVLHEDDKAVPALLQDDEEASILRADSKNDSVSQSVHSQQVDVMPGQLQTE